MSSYFGSSNSLSEPLAPGAGRGGPSRDLGAARSAYGNFDVEASRVAHAARAGAGAEEEHNQAGGMVKTIVFGGLDGILTSFAIVAGAVGAHLTPVAVLAMGVSNVLADAMSMGVGEYLSSRSYNSYVLREKEREAWELDNHPEGEIQEMVELFEQRGMGHDDAVEVIKRMSKYKEFFVNIMMTEELALPVPDPEDEVNSRKEGVVMFLAFAAFGMLPIVGFVAAPLLVPSLGDAALFSVACLFTAVALFGLGAFKASFGDKAYLRSGAETLALGGICAAVAFLVGRAVSGFAEESVPALFVDRPGYYSGYAVEYGAR